MACCCVDGIAGEVLLHAIKSCVGPAEYTEAAHRGWTKIYSAMLAVMVPEVVKFELSHKAEAQQTLAKRSSMASQSLRSFSDVISKASQSNLAVPQVVQDSVTSLVKDYSTGGPVAEKVQIRPEEAVI